MLQKTNLWIKHWGGLIGILFGSGFLIAGLKFASDYGALSARMADSGPNIAKIPAIERQLAAAQLEKLPIIEEQARKIPALDKRLFALGRSVDGSLIPRLNELSNAYHLAPIAPTKIEDISHQTKAGPSEVASNSDDLRKSKMMADLRDELNARIANLDEYKPSAGQLKSMDEVIERVIANEKTLNANIKLLNHLSKPMSNTYG